MFQKTRSSRIHKVIAATALFVFSSFNLSPQIYSEDFNISEDLYTQIKQDIKRELYEEVKAELKAEMDREIKTLVEQNVRMELQRQLAEIGASGPTHQKSAAAHLDVELKPGESLEMAVKRTVQEVFQTGQYRNYISDEDLDRVVAGNTIKPELSITSRYKKSLPYEQTAQAQPNAELMARQDYEIVGGEEQRTDSIERTLQQKGSMLLQRGKLQVEPSTSWAHFSSNSININGFSIVDVIVIGDVSVRKTRRDLFIQNLTLKYGLLNNLQLEAKIPYRGQFNRDTITSSSETTTGHTGIGDVEVGLSRQIAWEQGLMPDLVAAVNFKTKTGAAPYNREIGLGTGHYAVRTSLVAAKASDPAFIFGSLSYTHSFEETVDRVGKVQPGITVGYSLGLAIALSYQVAINFSFDHSITSTQKVRGTEVAGSFINSANVKIGANWALNERSSIDFSVGFGVTDDAPDVTAEVRVPISF